MATLKRRLYKKNSSGTYDTVYLETDASIITGTLPVSHGGTGNTTGLAASATKLATARTIRTNLASTSTASFNGTANITPGVTGILSVANGGTGVKSLDALKTALGVSNNIEETGNIILSANDTIDGWHRCNGAIIDDQYSELINKTNAKFQIGPRECIIDNLDLTGMYYIKTYNPVVLNDYIIIPIVYKNTSSSTPVYGYIYSDNMFNNYKFVKVANSSTENIDYILLTYDEAAQKYVITVYYRNISSSNVVYIITGYSSNINGSWSVNAVKNFNISSNATLKGIAAYNNKVVLSIHDRQSSNSVYLRIISGTYTTGSISLVYNQTTYINDNNSVSNVVYKNGYYVIMYKNPSNYIVCIYSQDGSSWHEINTNMYSYVFSDTLAYDPFNNQFVYFGINSGSGASIIYKLYANTPTSWSSTTINVNLTIRNAPRLSEYSDENRVCFTIFDSATPGSFIYFYENTGSGFKLNSKYLVPVTSGADNIAIPVEAVNKICGYINNHYITGQSYNNYKEIYILGIGYCYPVLNVTNYTRFYYYIKN